MANIDRIVNVQIALNTTGITQEGFSTLLCVGPHLNGLTRVNTYTGADQMLDDGFSADDKLYKMVSAAFSQIPAPAAVKVGRQAVNGFTLSVKQLGAQSAYTLTISAIDTDGNIDKKNYTYTNSGGGASDIMSALSASIAADTAAVVTVPSASSAVGLAEVGTETVAAAEEAGDTLHITAKDPSKAFRVEVSDNLSVTIDASAEAIADTMAAVMASDSDFYGIALVSKSETDIMDMADWAESAGKLYLTSLSGDGVKNSEINNDIGSKLMAKNYYRTAWWYHDLAESEFVEAAVAARCFAIDPGGETWALKKLAAITYDALTETEFNAISKKNGNTFERFRNISITQTGKVAAGEWIDVIRFRDWLEEEMKTNVLNLLINSDKVGYTDAGIGGIESRMRQALDLGQARGGIAPTEYDEDGNQNLGYTISMPLASSISANQKATRILKDVKFTARLAGAIHVINISGSLTYENLIQRQA